MTLGQLSVPTGAVKLKFAEQRLLAAFTLAFEGQVIAGNSLSAIVTVKLQVAVFPAATVTVNVFTVLPIGNVAPLAMPAVCIVVAPGQLSLPTGVVKVAMPLQSPELVFALTLPGHAMVGA